MSNTSSTPAISNSAYDKLKPIALILLPALAALYSGLAGFWGFPHPVEVVGSITLIDTFLGSVLHVSSSQYTPGSDSDHAGTLAITGYDDTTGHPDLALTLDPSKVVNTDGTTPSAVTLKVDDQSGVTPPPLNTGVPAPAAETADPAAPKEF